MGTLLKIDLPEEIAAALKAVGYTSERLSGDARLHLAASLFSRKVLSLEQAAQLAGMSLWNFIPFLAEMGIAVDGFDEEEIQTELDTAQWLSKEQKK